MAKGNQVVVVQNGGRQEWGVISGTPKPGTVVQIQAGTAFVNGRPTYEAYNPVDGDGGLPDYGLGILDIDYLQGKTLDDAYVSGDRCPVWIPAPGEEFNCLLKNISGTTTGDEVQIGTPLTIDAGTGKLIKAAGSSESPASEAIRPFVSLEVEEDLSADAHVHVRFTGY